MEINESGKKINVRENNRMGWGKKKKRNPLKTPL